MLFALFLGAGGRLNAAGPSLVIAYAVCGFFAFLILRALGELIMHRPSSGSFVSYAREFFGEKAAFATGWLYWLNWVMTAIVDVTAVALYMNFFAKYWAPIGDVPQWVFALGALVLVLGLNLVSVKVFGELEFWFALIKVVSLVAFLLVSRLRPAMAASSARRKYIVNVSAMEGQFSRRYKGPGHPHTNMAKASLNMLTRTSAEEMFTEDGILMTAVDTGWITDERPHHTKMRLADEGFHAPLDLVDGAARVYDPVVQGEEGVDLHGCFLKDYKPSPW